MPLQSINCFFSNVLKLLRHNGTESDVPNVNHRCALFDIITCMHLGTERACFHFCLAPIYKFLNCGRPPRRVCQMDFSNNFSTFSEIVDSNSLALTLSASNSSLSSSKRTANSKSSAARSATPTKRPGLKLHP